MKTRVQYKECKCKGITLPWCDTPEEAEQKAENAGFKINKAGLWLCPQCQKEKNENKTCD